MNELPPPFICAEHTEPKNKDCMLVFGFEPSKDGFDKMQEAYMSEQTG
jgi:hypothetical protein